MGKSRKKVRREGSGVKRGPRMTACGKISKHGRETRIAFEDMSAMGKVVVREVFGRNTARAEEIANA